MKIRLIFIQTIWMLNSIYGEEINEIKKSYFYDSQGILTIDGSVPGQSDPITVDMKASALVCGIRQYFIFTFCPNIELLGSCEEGISFCYEPGLTKKYMPDPYVLHTDWDLDVSKKCGESFRGFKVALVKAKSHDKSYEQLFYEIQTGYKKIPYYFPSPESQCISLWLGNDVNLLTSVRTFDGHEIFPVQILKEQNKKFKNYGVSNQSYTSAPWPDIKKLEYYEDYPVSLKMLYLDFKSKEFVPQMMFTVGPENNCSLFARVRSNNVGSCQTIFKEKAIQVKPYSNVTSFRLTIESGVNMNDTSGTRTKQETILDKEFEEEMEETNEEIQEDEDIEGSSGELLAASDEILSETTEHSVTQTDITPLWKKGLETWINKGAIIGCTLFTVLTFGIGNCRVEVELREIEQTTFHEAFTEKKLTNTKATHSFSQQHSVQQVMQTAFSNSKGTTKKSSHSEYKSMSNAVSKRNVFQFSIKIPEGKILFPMQMSVDCDGSRVKIPWIKFHLVDEKAQKFSEYDDEEYTLPADQSVIGIPPTSMDDDDYGFAKDAVSEQKKAAEIAFRPPPPPTVAKDVDYQDLTGIDLDKNTADQTSHTGDGDDDVDYSDITGQDSMNVKRRIIG